MTAAVQPAPSTAEVPPLRLLVVDDEALARLRLRHLIDELRAGGAQPVPQIVAEADSAAAATAALAALEAREGSPARGDAGIDAVLLDIGLPGLNGLALAATLRALPRPPAVVFVTAHAEHALQAFELQAIDYLTKPVRRERLQQALARAAQWRRGGTPVADVPAGSSATAAVPAEAGTSVLVLHERGRLLRLPHAEIVCLRAEHKTVLVRTATQSFVVDESLNELEQRLGAAFVRVHRNALVARRAIRALELRPGLEEEGGGDGWAVWVAVPGGGEWLAVSRRQVAAVKAALAGGAGGG